MGRHGRYLVHLVRFLHGEQLREALIATTHSAIPTDARKDSSFEEHTLFASKGLRRIDTPLGVLTAMGYSPLEHHTAVESALRKSIF